MYADCGCKPWLVRLKEEIDLSVRLRMESNCDILNYYRFCVMLMT